MELFGLIVFYLVLAIGFLLVVFGLPGTVVIWLDALVYGWLTRFETITSKLIVGLLTVTVVAEVADNLLAAAGARKYGTSNKGVAASLVGGIIGAILGANLSPLLAMVGFAAGPVVAILLAIIGPLIGAFVGSFAFVYFAERRRGQDKPSALRAGYGAVLGRAGGIILKLSLAVVMVALIVRAMTG